MTAAAGQIASTRRVPVMTAALAFMPKLGCPLCWPAIAGICALLGLPFSYVNPLLTTLVVLGLVVLLIVAARQRAIAGCNGLAIAALLMILIARLNAWPVWVGYAGSAALVVSAAWSWMAVHPGAAGSTRVCIRTGCSSHEEELT